MVTPFEAYYRHVPLVLVRSKLHSLNAKVLYRGSERHVTSVDDNGTFMIMVDVDKPERLGIVSTNHCQACINDHMFLISSQERSSYIALKDLIVQQLPKAKLLQELSNVTTHADGSMSVEGDDSDTDEGELSPANILKAYSLSSETIRRMIVGPLRDLEIDDAERGLGLYCAMFEHVAKLKKTLTAVPYKPILEMLDSIERIAQNDAEAYSKEIKKIISEYRD